MGIGNTEGSISRALPRIDRRHVIPLNPPKRPTEFPRPENFGQDPEPVIDFTGKPEKNMAQELKAISGTVQDKSKKQLDLLVQSLFDPEKKLDPVERLRSISDPKEKEYALRAFARSSAYNQLAPHEQAGAFNMAGLDRRERELYDAYKKRVMQVA